MKLPNLSKSTEKIWPTPSSFRSFPIFTSHTATCKISADGEITTSEETIFSTVLGVDVVSSPKLGVVTMAIDSYLEAKLN